MDQEHGERAAADDDHRLAPTRGRFVHGVQADGERIGERRFLEGDVARDRKAGALVRRHVRREAAGQIATAGKGKIPEPRMPLMPRPKQSTSVSWRAGRVRSGTRA
jgi:hypothetical protein